MLAGLPRPALMDLWDMGSFFRQPLRCARSRGLPRRQFKLLPIWPLLGGQKVLAAYSEFLCVLSLRGTGAELASLPNERTIPW